MTVEIEVPAHTMDSLRDLVARESLAGRQTSIDDLAEGIIVRTLDAADRGEWTVSQETPSVERRPQLVGVVLDDEELERRTRKLNAKPSAMAAMTARRDGITLREAAERFNVSHESVRQHYQRLYPNEARTRAWRPGAVRVDLRGVGNADIFDGGGKVGSREPDPHATQQEAATPDQVARLAVGNVAEPQLDPRTYARAEYPPPSPLVTESTDPIGEAAALRERIDALEAETKQYEDLRSEIDARILRNRVAIELAKQQLAANRKERR